MKFRTKYDRLIQTTEAGSPIKTIFAGELDKNHEVKVVKKGEENLYEYINSFSDSVNIHVLLNRFKNGDKESLLQRAGAYIDISSLPTNINEFIEMATNAENLFRTLPIEVKESFNNNVVEFISTIGDDDWKEKMAKSPKQIYSDIAQADIKANEARKEAIKNPNIVYGDQIVQEPDAGTQPVINPITGNEVNS